MKIRYLGTLEPEALEGLRGEGGLVLTGEDEEIRAAAELLRSDVKLSEGRSKLLELYTMVRATLVRATLDAAIAAEAWDDARTALEHLEAISMLKEGK